MSWNDVYELLWQVGGKAEVIDPAALKAATAEGPGDAETQLRIAAHIYKQIRKEGTNGQTHWEF